MMCGYVGGGVWMVYIHLSRVVYGGGGSVEYIDVGGVSGYGDGGEGETFDNICGVESALVMRVDYIWWWLGGGWFWCFLKDGRV